MSPFLVIFSAVCFHHSCLFPSTLCVSVITVCFHQHCVLCLYIFLSGVSYGRFRSCLFYSNVHRPTRANTSTIDQFVWFPAMCCYWFDSKFSNQSKYRNLNYLITAAREFVQIGFVDSCLLVLRCKNSFGINSNYLSL